MYENLKMLLKAKGISIEVLARLLNVHRDTVTNKLNGESEFTYSIVHGSRKAVSLLSDLVKTPEHTESEVEIPIP